MKEKIKSVTFYYPTTFTGGAQYLFVRMANCIASIGINVHYIDYEYGFSRNFLNDKVKKLNCIKNKKLTVDYDTVLIIPPSSILKIYTQLNLSENVKLFFWCMHHYNFLGLFPFFSKRQCSDDEKNKLFLKKYYKKEHSLMKKLVNDIYNKKNLVFMDYTTYKCNNYFFEFNSVEKRYLPIPINSVDYSPVFRLIDENIINIGYLGNLVDFKIPSLINIIENSDIYSKKYNKKIKIHIIGAGSEKDIFDKYEIKNDVEIIYNGILLENELNNYLLNNIDILFAMGTSCLEGAKLSIPSILTDPTYNEIQLDYKFRWLFESSGYSLGSFVFEPENSKHTFEDIVNNIYKNEGKKEFGEKCFEYFKNNHSIEAVADKLFNYLNESSDITIEYFKKSGLYKTKLQYFELIWKGLSIIKTFLKLNKN